MRFMICLAAFILTSCSTQSGPSPQNAVFAAKNAYEAALIVSVRYNELPRCGAPTSPPLCSDAAAVDVIRKANTSARAALDAAEATVRAPNITTDAKQAVVTSATNAVAALQAILAVYTAPKKPGA